MKICVRLSNSGGQLDHREITIRDDDDTAEISEQIQEIVETWILAPGDTITIVEM